MAELAVAGDTVSDVESGLRAGASEELEQAEAPHIIEPIIDLLPLVGVVAAR